MVWCEQLTIVRTDRAQFPPRPIGSEPVRVHHNLAQRHLRPENTLFES